MAQQQLPPQLDLELVQQYVMAAHGDLDKVKEFLAQEPALLNASWNWGGSDWESALEAAAHTGQRDIALYLLEQGARFSLFAAAMLGQLELVQVILTAHPEMKHAKGAHGIPLMRHAQFGGEEAATVVDYLKSLGV